MKLKYRDVYRSIALRRQQFTSGIKPSVHCTDSTPTKHEVEHFNIKVDGAASRCAIAKILSHPIRKKTPCVGV